MGCFNVTCAVTGTPICGGDEVVVGICYSQEHLNVNTLFPFMFRANYNEYGSVEDFDKDHKQVKLFESIFSDDTVPFTDSVRIGLDNNVSSKLHWATDVRIIYVHSHVWDKIVNYGKLSCGSFAYHNPDSWMAKVDYYSEAKESLLKAIEYRTLQEKKNPTNDDEWRLRTLMLEFMSAEIGNLSASRAHEILDICNDYSQDAVELIAKNYEEAKHISNFCDSTNRHLISTYSGQETNDEEYEVLLSIMYDHSLKVKRFREE